MITEVHMADGRTVFQLPSRKALRKLIEGTPEDIEKIREQAFVIWDKRGDAVQADAGVMRTADQGDGDWKPIKLSKLRAASIAIVCEAASPCPGVAEIVEQRKARWEEKQAEEAAA